ncbi:MAG: extracellular solute-binding protein [Ruminococcus sp.]|nr:extracellular solute-binding protein [Ruminococcus sp.]
MAPSALADNKSASNEASADAVDAAKRENTYSAYLKRYADAERPDEEATVYGKDFKAVEGSDISCSVESVDGKDSVFKWASQTGQVDFTVNIPKTGLYFAQISYEALEGTTSDVEFALRIDGKSPYATAERITMPKVWVNESGDEIQKDSKGNDIRPGQREEVMWQLKDIEDIDGLSNDPLAFYMEAGEHKITLDSEKAQFAIEYIKFYNHKPLKKYDATEPNFTQATGKRITLEGELAKYKSAKTLFPTSDNTSYLTSSSNGSSPTKEKYNTIGGQGNWNKSTESITWEFNVDAAGWYKIGIRARQDQMRGMYSNRRLYINGEVPYEEADQIKFFYDTEWNVTSPKSGDETMYFYLESGKNTLTLEAIPGEIGEIMDEIDDIVYNTNSYYRQIRQITGPSPDEYNNYNIDKAIPTCIEDFEKFSKQLIDAQKKIEDLAGTGGTEAVTLRTMSIILDKCVDKPDRIPSMMSQIKDNITAVSAWVTQYRFQPLEVDMIELCTEDEDFTSTDSSFFKGLSYGFSKFIGSFFEDYNSLSDLDENSSDVMTAWITTGRDNAKIVTNLINNDYNLNARTKINVKLVVGGIVEATFSGKGPDIALFLGGDYPIQLAARDVLVDLSKMDGFDDVIKNFSKDATVLYQYNGGTYGIPLEQQFPMLFYRSDILEEYSIDPKTDLTTWDGLINVLPALQRNYMEVGLILAQMGSAGVTQISATTEAGNTFAMLLLQQGINYYNEDQTKTNFDTNEAVNAFDKWTKFYTTYSFSQTYDAFTRFRMGDMPIIINNYGFANQLATAAPEIKGCWDFQPVPGTVQPDGSINHAASSAGAGVVVFKKAPNVDDAWDFVKWFTSTDVQTSYGQDIEAVLGTLGRYASANVETLGQLSWTSTEYKKLREQLDSQVEIPVIPASYGVTRNLMNAFRQVVNDADNARDTLFWYNKDINDEIERKLEDLDMYDYESSNE